LQGKRTDRRDIEMAKDKEKAFMKDWYRKLVKGGILEYARGLKKRASLNWVFGEAEKAMARRYVTKQEIVSMISEIEEGPYLPFLSKEEKMNRLQPLRQLLDSKDIPP